MQSVGRFEFIKDYDKSLLARLFNVSEARIVSAQQYVDDNGLIDFVIDPDKNRGYYFVRELGRGSYGRVYTAKRRKSNTVRSVFKVFMLNGDTMPSNGSSRGYRGISAFASMRKYSDEELSARAATREYLVSSAIMRRLGRSFCEGRVVCAEELFTFPTVKRGYIRFPFVAANSLYQYLVTLHHPRMRYVKERIATAGYTGYTVPSLVELYKTLPGSASSLGKSQLLELLEDLVPRYNGIVTISLIITMQLLSTIAQLHSVLIFHRDIKTQNILVLDDNLVLSPDEQAGNLSVSIHLIDFGLACAFPLESDSGYTEEDGDLIFCEDVYVTTPLYRDPLVSYQDELYKTRRISDEDRIVERDAKFDLYAAAKVIQYCFDSDSISPASGRERYPVIRTTSFMPDKLPRLLQQLTGESFYTTRRPNPRLLPDDLFERVNAYALRPMADDAVYDLSVIIDEWSESGQLSVPDQ